MKYLSAAIFMLLFCMTLPLGDSLVRLLTANGIPVHQIIFLRSIFIVCILGPVVGTFFRFKIEKKLVWIYILRSVCFFMAVFAWLSVLEKVELPQLYSVGFLSPIFASIISVIVLKEQLTPVRIFGIIGGFIGAMIVLRPGAANANPYLWVGVFCALNWSISMVVSKYLSQSEPQAKLTFFLSTSFIAITAPFVGKTWAPLDANQWVLIVILGGLVLTSHLLVLSAYKRAPLTVLTPIEFSSLIFSASFGWLFFKEGIDAMTLLGGSVIFLSASISTIFGDKQLKRSQIHAVDSN
tara:strand:- start:51 stop:935 length:885 start_codon:yes stop_codon:yes gene_type:complete